MTTRTGLVAFVPWLVMLTGATPCVYSQNTIFLVRHAEKEASPPTDPHLSAEGKQRAETLREALKEAGVTAIFTSTFIRTKETAAPLATALSIMPQEDPMNDPKTLVDRIRKLPAGGNVLIVGHSDSIPKLLEALGHAPKVVIDDSEFDNLFIVTPGEVMRPRVIRMRYRR